MIAFFYSRNGYIPKIEWREEVTTIDGEVRAVNISHAGLLTD
jgi:hypothetical protein